MVRGPGVGPAVGVPGAALRQVSLRPATRPRAPGVQEPAERDDRAAPVEQRRRLARRVPRRRRRGDEGRARGEGDRLLRAGQHRRRGRPRRLEVGVLRGSGRLPARARRGRVLQRGGPARRGSPPIWRRARSRRRLPSADRRRCAPGRLPLPRPGGGAGVSCPGGCGSGAPRASTCARSFSTSSAIVGRWPVSSWSTARNAAWHHFT